MDAAERRDLPTEDWSSSQIWTSLACNEAGVLRRTQKWRACTNVVAPAAALLMIRAHCYAPTSAGGRPAAWITCFS
jgi:hypothetical protein